MVIFNLYILKASQGFDTDDGRYIHYQCNPIFDTLQSQFILQHSWQLFLDGRWLENGLWRSWQSFRGQHYLQGAVRCFLKYLWSVNNTLTSALVEMDRIVLTAGISSNPLSHFVFMYAQAFSSWTWHGILWFVIYLV